MSADKDRIAELEAKLEHMSKLATPADFTTQENKFMRSKIAELERKLAEQQAGMLAIANHTGLEVSNTEELNNLLAKAKEEGRKEAIADTARLDWMTSNETFIAWDREGESCRVFTSEDIEPICGWPTFYTNARKAIDAAMLASAPKPQGETK